MDIKKYAIMLIFSVVICFESPAQLLKTNSADNRMLFNIRIDGVTIHDDHALYAPHKKHGMYPSIGFELQKYDYKPGGLRQRLNFDLAAEALYILYQMVRKDNWKDPDGRYGTTSYFITGLFEYVAQIPVFTNNYLSTGLGGALFDLNYSHYLYDVNGEPVNPQKSAVSQHGFYGGWSLFADVLIHQSLTLHTDFYYGYSFYNGSQDKLKKMGEPAQPFH